MFSPQIRERPTSTMEMPVRAVAVSGSPSRSSRSGLLLGHAISCLEERGATVTKVVLLDIPADELLGRASGPALEAALSAVGAAAIVVASTPVYRATYSGLLKVFFDQLPRDSLAGTVALPIATGAVPEHTSTIDDVRRLFESLGATVTPDGVYGLDRDFSDGVPAPLVLGRVERGVQSALSLARLRAAELNASIGGT